MPTREYKSEKIGKKTAFYNWFITFLEEKKIDMSDVLVHTDDKIIQVGDVCQAIVDTTSEEQKQIKDMLVHIDFKNGDVLHYLKHLSQAL